MRIGELARRTGLSRDTIRFYERYGLIVGARQPHETNRYKDYPETNIERMAIVSCLKPLGFTLSECRAALEARGSHKANRKRLAAKKLAEIEARLTELTAARDRLRSILERHD